MQPTETIVVEDTTVGCDGGDGPLGHPMVYLNIGPKGSVECPYCSRHFVLAANRRVAGGH
jgi:uncharacterized Zn-finger protein